MAKIVIQKRSKVFKGNAIIILFVSNTFKKMEKKIEIDDKYFIVNKNL